MAAEGSVFVTVGTTKFEQLVQAVLEPGFINPHGYDIHVWDGWTGACGVFYDLFFSVSPTACLQVLQEKGYNGLVVQAGRGSYLPPPVTKDFHLECYDYKSSLQDDLQQASLVISHGGAGSIMEALDAGKRVIVVINDSLMDNHQTELAEQLAADRHLVHTTPNNLLKTLQEFDSSQIARYKPGEPMLFGSFLDKMMSFKDPKLP